MIVWLASFPRSGSTFLRLALHSLYGIRTPTIYGNGSGVASELGILGELPPSLADAAASPEPVFIKTHELPRDGHRAIYIVRDGRDALVSFAHALREREFLRTRQRTSAGRALYGRLAALVGGGPSFDETLRELIMGRPQHWSEHYRAWTTRRVPTAVVHFETLIADPAASVRAATDALGLGLMPADPATLRSIPSFDELHRRRPDFFRNGSSGQWRQQMTRELQELFWALHGQAMEQAGYSRDGVLRQGAAGQG